MRRIFLSSLLATFIVSAGAYFYYTLPKVAELKQRNPKTTALMDLREQEYKKKNIRGPRQQTWVGYGAISEHLKKAVLVSEDAAFFSHKGIDMNELKAALKKDWETLSFARGGSTITMQLAKNLYLTPSKNPLRKLKEIVIAHQLEQALSKPRIFEIYLNVVEWGRNIYGIEAAARHYFGKSAAALDPLDALAERLGLFRDVVRQRLHLPRRVPARDDDALEQRRHGRGVEDDDIVALDVFERVDDCALLFPDVHCGRALALSLRGRADGARCNR